MMTFGCPVDAVRVNETDTFDDEEANENDQYFGEVIVLCLVVECHFASLPAHALYCWGQISTTSARSRIRPWMSVETMHQGAGFLFVSDPRPTQSCTDAIAVFTSLSGTPHTSQDALIPHGPVLHEKLVHGVAAAQVESNVMIRRATLPDKVILAFCLGASHQLHLNIFWMQGHLCPAITACPSPWPMNEHLQGTATENMAATPPA